MRVQAIEWKDEFNVGVDYIDEAHQKLFNMLRKISGMLESDDYNLNKHACLEALRFLKGYTVEHFTQEEAYQKRIGYSGYEMHKSLHDNLRFVTLPHLEEDLKSNDFSPKAIERFIGVFAGWLTGHILIEDRAITGKVSSRWNHPKDISGEALLNQEMCHFFRDLCNLELNLYTSHYEGAVTGKAFYYEMDYGEGITITLVADLPIILHMTQVMLGRKYDKIDNVVMAAHVQLAQSVAKGILTVLYPEREFKLVDHKALDNEKLKAVFAQGFPKYSLQWKSSEGYIATCVNVRKNIS